MAVTGVSKLYYAPLTVDDQTSLTYDTPVYLPGIKEIGIVPKQNTEKLWAENKLWDQDTTLDEVEVTINRTDLSSAEEAALLGQTRATEGGVYASDTDVAPYIALLAEADKRNKEKRYIVLYKGKFSLPEDNAKTKEGKTEFQTPTIKGIFQTTINNSMWRYKVDSDDPDCPTDINATFFTSVIIPTELQV